MQLYFIKATFTNNVYKLSDFFVGGNYNLIATKMLDINFRPDDGLSSFITKNITLPDTTKIWEHTHIIVPEYEKIYRIASVDYLNVGQYQVTVDDDPLIANYPTLSGTDIILTRTNDTSLFRGVNDINDVTVKESVETKILTSISRTGKWALIFFQNNTGKASLGLKMGYDLIAKISNLETFANLTALTTKYPEVATTTPNLYPYYQKVVFVTSESKAYQCVFNDSIVDGLVWVEDATSFVNAEIYFSRSSAGSTKLNDSDVASIIVAIPFESMKNGTDDIYTMKNFIGPIDAGDVVDIKIVDDIVFSPIAVSYSLVGRVMTKNVTLSRGRALTVYSDAAMTTAISNRKIFILNDFADDIDLDPDYFASNPAPTDAEPFKKYDLYIFGKRFAIPYYMTDKIRMMIAINSGVINFGIYYNDKRNILASGSFTHSMRYQVDKLDQFYNQNPTYKEQFFTKMALDSMKTIAGGAVGGSVLPGLGTAGGVVLGTLGAGVDAGISMINFNFMEKSMRLQPDQIFGDMSEITLQLINIFGIYWVKRTSENADYMKIEYDLKGFPVTKVTKITSLTGATSFLGTTKIVYGELKGVIKNNYITGFINQKLKEGVIFI